MLPRGCVILTRNPNLLPGVDQAGIFDIVVVDQRRHGGSVVLGDAPEGITGLHGVCSLLRCRRRHDGVDGALDGGVVIAGCLEPLLALSAVAPRAGYHFTRQIIDALIAGICTSAFASDA